MGLVLIALGASGMFAASGHRSTAAIAMVAALLLMVNHSLFKGALFLAAGAVQVATGTRDLDPLGGLMRRMPVTGVVFLVGALSVAALPPLNGFVGEWLLFQGLLHGLPTSNTSVVISVAVAVAALALTGGLTVAAFVKATGIGFLGRPRSEEAAQAHEVAITMRAGAGALAALWREQRRTARRHVLDQRLDLVAPPGSARRARTVAARGRAGGGRPDGHRDTSSRASTLARLARDQLDGTVGVRPSGADGAHAVHGDVVRRTAAAGGR
jgi:hypothetical protein